MIVPGNHDVNWKLSERYFAERAGNEAPAMLPYWPKLQSYAELFARFYEGQPGISFTESEPHTLFEYPELHVVVAGLNSIIAESHRKEDHYGFFGEQQLRLFAEKLRPSKESGVLRIAAAHHDPLRLGENEAARQDFKDFKGMLAPYLNLVVHGHIHEEQLDWLDRDLPVFLAQTARREPLRRELPRDLGVDEEEALRERFRPRRDDEVRPRLVSTGPPQPIDQVLISPGEPWILVLGAPGAGKSALTRWLVLKLCAPGESLPGLPADLVPVRIELRRYRR